MPGGPSRMRRRALEGLEHVDRVAMDLERDLFRVTAVRPDAPTEQALLEAPDAGAVPRMRSHSALPPGTRSR